MKRTKATAFTITSLLFFLNTHTQKVEVTNGITEKMTGYKHFFGTFKPDTFSITVNKQPMKLGETKTFHLPDGKLNVRYDFEYEGHRKGAKIVTFEVPKDMISLSFTFDWKKKLKLKGAYFDSDVYDRKAVVEISTLPSKTELLGMLLSTMQGVPRNFVSLLNNVPAGLINLLRNYLKKKEKGEN